MTKQLAIMVFMGIMLIASPALAGGQEVCPNQGKVESVVPGDLDDIVLDAGTMVCIKAGTTVVHVVADGVQTLAELIGNGKNISHYTIDDWPTTTTTTSPTTTTTVPEVTTTTVPETTTTVPETTTTVPETTTTTVAETTTTTTGSATTSVPEAVTTTVAGPETTVPSELPHTGINTSVWVASALGLLLSGGLLLRKMEA